MTLVETGTRDLIGAVFGPTGEGETSYARRLLPLLKPDMLVLWDKGFDGNAFLAQVSATGAQFVGRLRSNRRTPILARSPTAPITQSSAPCRSVSSRPA
ncbi:transposase [Nonomuraea basaltis]|uniref:transposase n=1 Tax=Nonomuraea basaltis TaxID=2495887 RepID=UPI00110C42F2|nr:transposase [Nonomuraea basaltis]TMR96589.1 transposase [Nonomuraea basaltis]